MLGLFLPPRPNFGKDLGGSNRVVGDRALRSDQTCVRLGTFGEVHIHPIEGSRAVPGARRRPQAPRAYFHVSQLLGGEFASRRKREVFPNARGDRTNCASRWGLAGGLRRWLCSWYGRGGVRAFRYFDLGRATRPAVRFERVHPNRRRKRLLGVKCGFTLIVHNSLQKWA